MKVAKNLHAEGYMDLFFCLYPGDLSNVLHVNFSHLHFHHPTPKIIASTSRSAIKLQILPAFTLCGAAYPYVPTAYVDICVLFPRASPKSDKMTVTVIERNLSMPSINSEI